MAALRPKDYTGPDTLLTAAGDVMALTLYLGGPDVFMANALDIGRRKRDLCRVAGFEGLFPLDNDAPRHHDAAAIFRANCGLMRRARAGLFNLSPFRGPSADAGTVFELGFMFALGKPVYGYSNDARVYAERVRNPRGPATVGWEHDDYTVEDFGLGDNLMIGRAIAESGGVLTCVHARAGEEALAALPAFEACLDAVRQDFPEEGSR
jgi:nucleoside 2-deoxyribosyltransferase